MALDPGSWQAIVGTNKVPFKTVLLSIVLRPG
jgi:hypothetical protein